MVAPVTTHYAEAGCAALDVELVCGESAATSIFATSPLKLLTPRSRGQSVWAYASSFGGGLVAGDQTRLDLHIGPGARCFMGTQASTKIYRNPAQLPSGHVTHARLEENSLLVFAPDPVQAFAGSVYTQRQEFHLASGAGLALVDWFTSGRAARGERWAFSKFQSRNEVWSIPILPADEPRDGARTAMSARTPALEFADSAVRAPAKARRHEQLETATSSAPLGEEKVKTFGERIFLDSLWLDQTDNALAGSHRMGRFNCVAMLLLIGEPVAQAAKQLLETISAQPVNRCAPLVSSASPVRNGALLRVAGESVEEVGRKLHRHLAFLSVMLGDDPWARKW